MNTAKMESARWLRTERPRWHCLLFLAFVLAANLASSFSLIRSWIAHPLWVHDEDAAGETAYVMAAGHAYWERLRAASDLYHMKRVPRIAIMDDSEPAGFNFVTSHLDNRTEQTVAYLGLLGVPRDKIDLIAVDATASFGSLSEARAVAARPFKGKRIVVVTSAPHTRRSALCFRRSLPADIRVEVFSASAPMESSEIDSPLWIEYFKLAIYFVVA